MGGKKLWGLWHRGKCGFLKGHVYTTKAMANRQITIITARKRDPITNYVTPREIPKEFYKKTKDKK